MTDSESPKARKVMRGIFGAPIWTKGACKTCRRKRDLYKERCHPCRQPEDRRQLVDAGVPSLSAACLANIVRKCMKQGRKLSAIVDVLTMVHPLLMENISINSSGTMSPKSLKYQWIRGNGWFPKP